MALSLQGRKPATIWVALCTALLVGWMAFKPAGGTVYIVIEDLVRLVGPLGVMLLWRPRMATERRPGPSWTVPMLGLSVGAFAAGSAVSLI